jgi:DNA polymerase elongation subunit (family B)
MIKGFVVLEIDPDIVTGYNIMGFDFMYIYNALPRPRDLVNMLEMGRIEPARDNTVYVEHVSALPPWATTS